MFQKNGIKFLNYTAFSINYFIKMDNDESNKVDEASDEIHPSVDP